MLASVLEVHTAWAWVVVLGNAAAGVWCLGAHWVPALRTPVLWWFVGVAEATIGVQVVLGVVLVAGEGVAAPEFHIFYGFLTVLSVAILYSYRFQIRAWQYLLYGLGSLFIMGLGIRAIVLG